MSTIHSEHSEVLEEVPTLERKSKSPHKRRFRGERTLTWAGENGYHVCAFEAQELMRVGNPPLGEWTDQSRTWGIPCRDLQSRISRLGFSTFFAVDSLRKHL